MSEIKVGDVVSELHRNGFEYWTAKKVTQINRWGDLRDDSFVAGGTTFYFKNRDWVKGLHKSLIPEGFAIVPIEPTDQMLSHAQVMCGASHPDYEFDYKECWDSMINAAPKPTDK